MSGPTPTTNYLDPHAWDQMCFNLVSSAVSKGGRLWQDWSDCYERNVCQAAGKVCGQLWAPLNNAMATLLRIAPIALAFLVVASPIGLTSSFLNSATMTFALSTTPDLFSKQGKVKICQGGALAAGLHTSLTLASLAIYGLSIPTIFSLTCGTAVTLAFYYASRHYQLHG